MPKGTDLLLCLFGQTAELRKPKLILLMGSLVIENSGMNMWRRNCPVCRKQLEKKLPTETVPCTCGKFVWKG